MVILDTSIIIDYLRQLDKKDSHFLKILQNTSEDETGISTITLQELYEGKSTRDKEREFILLSAISSLKIIEYTYQIAQLAGTLSRDASKQLEFADAAIAATALVNTAQLLTLNKKDFEGIKGLELVNI